MVWSTAQSALYKAVDDFNSGINRAEKCHENTAENCFEKHPENCDKKCGNYEQKKCDNFGEKNARKCPEKYGENCSDFEQKNAEKCSENCRDFERKNCDNFSENNAQKHPDNFCEKTQENQSEKYRENRSKNPRFFSENICDDCQKRQKSRDFAEKTDCKNLQNDAKFTAKDCKNGIFANSPSQLFADKDFILLAGLIFILMNEKADSKLILALVFVLLG